jgi:hypothetical protein
MDSVRTDQRKKITNIFLSGKVSATLVIPVDIAKRNGLVDGSHVVVEEVPAGILIRKLQI